MELLIARHGQSTGNVADYDVPDGPLTDMGKRQAQDLARVLRENPPTHIFASPLLRALETASAIAAECGRLIEVWKDLYEIRDLGRYVGPSVDELRRQFPVAEFGDELEADGWIYDGRETLEQAYKRGQRVLAKLKATFGPEDRVLIVAHAGFNKMLLMNLLNIPLNTDIYLNQANCCLNHLRIEGERIWVGSVNDTSHLRLEDTNISAALG